MDSPDLNDGVVVAAAVVVVVAAAVAAAVVDGIYYLGLPFAVAVVVVIAAAVVVVVAAVVAVAAVAALPVGLPVQLVAAYDDWIALDDDPLLCWGSGLMGYPVNIQSIKPLPFYHQLLQT